jgi:hypothetical protein
VLSKQTQPIPARPSPPPPPPQPWSIDLRNVPIPHFGMPVEDMRQLAAIFLESAERARRIEVETIRRSHSGARAELEIARLPKPRIEITDTNGRFTVINDVAGFSSDSIPPTVKSVEFYNFKSQFTESPKARRAQFL